MYQLTFGNKQLNIGLNVYEWEKKVLTPKPLVSVLVTSSLTLQLK